MKLAVAAFGGTVLAVTIDRAPIIAWQAPAKTVSEANGREHWAKKAARTKNLRALGRLHTLAKRAPLQRAKAALPAGIVVDLCRVAPSAGLDDDNLRSSLKASRDGIADALGIDDRDPRVTWTYWQRRGPYAVECTIAPKE